MKGAWVWVCDPRNAPLYAWYGVEVIRIEILDAAPSPA